MSTHVCHMMPKMGTYSVATGKFPNKEYIKYDLHINTSPKIPKIIN